jgi:hypothetical protein
MEGSRGQGCLAFWLAGEAQGVGGIVSCGQASQGRGAQDGRLKGVPGSEPLWVVSLSGELSSILSSPERVGPSSSGEVPLLAMLRKLLWDQASHRQTVDSGRSQTQTKSIPKALGNRQEPSARFLFAQLLAWASPTLNPEGGLKCQGKPTVFLV